MPTRRGKGGVMDALLAQKAGDIPIEAHHLGKHMGRIDRLFVELLQRQGDGVQPVEDIDGFFIGYHSGGRHLALNPQTGFDDGQFRQDALGLRGMP